MRDGDGLVLDGELEEILCGAVTPGDQEDGEELLQVAHAAGAIGALGGLGHAAGGLECQ